MMGRTHHSNCRSCEKTVDNIDGVQLLHSDHPPSALPFLRSKVRSKESSNKHITRDLLKFLDSFFEYNTSIAGRGKKMVRSASIIEVILPLSRAQNSSCPSSLKCFTSRWSSQFCVFFFVVQPFSSSAKNTLAAKTLPQ